VRFIVTNRRQIRHEFSIGSDSEQGSHSVMMRNMSNMVHRDPNAVTVEAGMVRIVNLESEPADRSKEGEYQYE